MAMLNNQMMYTIMIPQFWDIPTEPNPQPTCAARRAQRLLHQFLGLRDTLQRQIRQGLEALATEKPLA